MIPLINRIAAITHANSRRGATNVQTRGAENGRTGELQDTAKSRRERAAKRRAYTQQLAHLSADFADSKDADVYAENPAEATFGRRSEERRVGQACLRKW